MAEGLPIFFDEAELVRLHSLAYATALQSGAKGYELEEVTDQIFRSLAVQANRTVFKTKARSALRLVERR